MKITLQDIFSLFLLISDSFHKMTFYPVSQKCAKFGKL